MWSPEARGAREHVSNKASGGAERGFVWSGEASLSSCQVDRGLEPPRAPSCTNGQHAEHDAEAKQTGNWEKVTAAL